MWLVLNDDNYGTWYLSRANADTASTHKFDSEEGEFNDDTFLEELFNTSMESLDSSGDSSDELTQ